MQLNTKHFVLTIIREYFKIRKEYNNLKPTHNSAAHCWICEEEYKYGDTRVMDHCHITGKYRGSAHSNCNLQLRIEPSKMHVPVIFHNGSSYDNIRKFFTAKICENLRFCKFSKVYGIIFRKSSKSFVSLRTRKVCAVLRSKYFVS